MPMNPKLIQHGIDDEEYECCPTLGTLMVTHFSTPENHNPLLYGADGLFFATNLTRRLYLRPAFRNEFDIFTTEQEFQDRPMLWVLVSQLWPGFHEVTPRWRGKSFWHDLDTDQAVAKTVMDMSMRGGLHLAEWYGFISDQRIRKSDAARHRSNRGIN